MRIRRSSPDKFGVSGLLLPLVVASIIHPANVSARESATAWFQCPGNITFPPAIIKGKHFVNSETGALIPIRGLVYYPRPNDGPLSVTHSVDFFTDEFKHVWEPDIANFQKLGINALRIYAVDPSKYHDSFMCALQAAGIHVMIGLLADCSDCGIGSDAAPSCYPPSLKTRGQYIINTFSKYNNTLVFSAGNEVGYYATNHTTALNAPCQKQFLRDMRAYIASCSSVTNSVLPRRVPIGVVTADFDRNLNAFYYGCRSNLSDALENAEWYGLNAYLHCNADATSWEQLDGYQRLRQDLVHYSLPIPVMLAEFGCRDRGFPQIGQFQSQRTWLQVDALSQPVYQEVLVGGFVFEYSAEKRIVATSAQNQPFPYYNFMKLQYGIGYYTPETCNHGDIPCEYQPYPEFDLLAAKYQALQTSNATQGDGEKSVANSSASDDGINQQAFPVCPDEIPSIGSFAWVSAEEPDLPCSVLPTWAPTMEPSNAPTMAPTTTTRPFPTVRSSSEGNRLILIAATISWASITLIL